MPLGMSRRCHEKARSSETPGSVVALCCYRPGVRLPLVVVRLSRRVGAGFHCSGRGGAARRDSKVLVSLGSAGLGAGRSAALITLVQVQVQVQGAARRRQRRAAGGDELCGDQGAARAPEPAQRLVRGTPHLFDQASDTHTHTHTRGSARVRARRELTCGFWDLTSQVNALSARMLFCCES